MRLWTALGLLSAAASVLTLGAAVILGLGLMLGLNGFSESDGAPALIAYFVAALGGNVLVVALIETVTDRGVLAYVARTDEDAGLCQAARARLQCLAGTG